tara:strand:+ start:131 stop:478 length:348 start_codon:yes stop_codon:yes gene_type:complete
MAFKMYGKSPMMKALVGKQVNLPANLKAKIEAAPETPMSMYKDSPMSMYGKSVMKKNEQTDREKKIARNKEFNANARKTGLLPTFKSTAEKEKWYSNKANVNMLNKKQAEYFKEK